MGIMSLPGLQVSSGTNLLDSRWRTPKKIYSRRYFGNKYKLLPFISTVINSECGEFSSFFDAFSGTGSVASAFLDKDIVTNDILYSNYITHIAWFKNSEYDKYKIISLLEHYNNIPDTIPENYMSQTFSDTYFGNLVCRKIGYIREDIESKWKMQEINEKERAILITSLLYAMDSVANTCGHYDVWRNDVWMTDKLVLHPLSVFSGTSTKNQFFNTDTNELAKTVKCDVVYLDPPYNSRQYCDSYHLLENVARWEQPTVSGKARKMSRDSLKSNYCKESATDALEELVDTLSCKYIILSYNSTGDKADARSNAKISDDDIVRILSKKGTIKIFGQDYKMYSTGNSAISENEERLFVCKVFDGSRDLMPTVRPVTFSECRAEVPDKLKKLNTIQLF